jgi:hypothetical protein
MRGKAIEAGSGAKAQGFQQALHGFHEAVLGDVVAATGQVITAKIAAGHGPSPEACGVALAHLVWAGGLVGQGRQVQGSEVAVPDPADAAFHAAGHQGPVDAVKQPAQAIAAARRQSHATVERAHALQSLQARVVVAREPLVTRQR